MLRLASLSAAAGLLVATALPATADSYTTRIEPRPFYGATVTLEEGVRVFRPLPPTRHVIINPQGRTPLSLHHSDVRVTEERTINTYEQRSSEAPVYGGHGGLYAPPYGYGHRGDGKPHAPGVHGGGGMPPGGR